MMRYETFSSDRRFESMNWAFIRALIVLPGTVAVLIPALILWVSAGTKYAAEVARPDQAVFWFALLVAGSGLALRVWTDVLFLRFGNGTLAPWNPPTKLVIRGPYRHVRNPMISSVVIILLGECLFFQSWPLAAWVVLFFGVHLIYFPVIEEKGLIKRFGNDYLIYKINVPRWIPRMQPWPGSTLGANEDSRYRQNSGGGRDS
ncbi:MAG: isoprenylcysteine carboxylmethyltransferase family protein, partial [Acidiferrobacterales bacterium]|nr:isoprenylcysteine carboxylmethyltransferase family protein [Acidiferrobacterales bacterium]